MQRDMDFSWPDSNRMLAQPTLLRGFIAPKMGTKIQRSSMHTTGADNRGAEEPRLETTLARCSGLMAYCEGNGNRGGK